MLLIDISMVMHRSYHAMDFLKNSKGEPTGMEFGTLRTIEALRKNLKSKPVLCFDLFHKKDKGETYKANRADKPPEFYERLGKLTTVLQALFDHAYEQGREADEILYGFTRTYPGPHIIYSNDGDLLQAIQPGTMVIKSHNSEMFFWDEAKVWEKYFVRPNQFALWKALVGDAGDNIPGLKRIGKEYAAELVREAYNAFPWFMPTHALEKVLDEASLSKTQRTNWELFRPQLFENWKLVKLPDELKPVVQKPTGASVKEYFAALEITSLEACEETEF